MKKYLLMTVAGLFLSAPAVFAQIYGSGEGRINVDDIKSKIEKSDEDIKDPKKEGRWQTWLERGNVYLAADQAPSKGVFRGMTEDQIKKIYPTGAEERPDTVIKGEKGESITYNVREYPRLIVYMHENKLAMWEENKIVIDPEALTKSAEAYSNAFLLDGKATEPAIKGMEKIIAIVKDKANTYQRLGKYDKAGKEYRRSYDIQKLPPFMDTDTTDLFFAAMNYAVEQEHEDALKSLRELHDMEYYKDGDVQFFMYHSYTGIDEPDSARMLLLEGAKMFPDVSKIYRSLLVVYAMDASLDLTEIAPIIDKAMANPEGNDIDKAKMYNSLAQAYQKRNMYDEALEYYLKASKADPKEFMYPYNVAWLYMQKADTAMQEAQEVFDSMSADEHKKLGDAINGYYLQSVPYLEKALSVSPDETRIVKLLYDITFRLRDSSDEIMGKSQKYEKMLENMEGKGKKAEASGEKNKPAEK